MIHLSTKFHENRPVSFCIILLTDKQTDKQTENITSLVEVIMKANSNSVQYWLIV